MYGGGTGGYGGIYHLVLREVTLTYERQRPHQLTLAVAGGERVGFHERLYTHYVVGTLVADNLGGGKIHHLYVLRHDDVGGYIGVDIDFLLGRSLRCDGAQRGSRDNYSDIHNDMLFVFQ